MTFFAILYKEKFANVFGQFKLLKLFLLVAIIIIIGRLALGFVTNETSASLESFPYQFIIFYSRGSEWLWKIWVHSEKWLWFRPASTHKPIKIGFLNRKKISIMKAWNIMYISRSYCTFLISRVTSLSLNNIFNASCAQILLIGMRWYS